VFCYFGDLKPVIEACKGNKLCFSVEAWDGLKDYTLSLAGRYKHRKDYVLSLLGDDASCEDIILRQEDGEDVPGWLFIK
jgi:predicted TPR repeat methyltransferase